ncbi:Rab1a [Hexamita inflata]|uniref:Rab1a n=1 Tax=Hexamita inflata TaxID=28002 RepID=A0AA86UMA5_9EUKA|nr:Rab1a [Hexamita inflata]
MTLRIVTVGSRKSGKTYLANKLLNSDNFQTDIMKTIYQNVNGIEYKTIIQDLHRTERFEALQTNHCRGVDGVLLVFNVSDKQSFKNCSMFVQDIKEKSNAEIILIGNKWEEKREVNLDEAVEFAQLHNANYYEVEKPETQMKEIFEKLVQSIVQKKSAVE